MTKTLLGLATAALILTGFIVVSTNSAHAMSVAAQCAKDNGGELRNGIWGIYRPGGKAIIAQCVQARSGKKWVQPAHLRRKTR